MKCYVKYLNCENNFQEAKMDFDNFELAWTWILKTCDNPSKDLIHYY